MRLLLRLPFRTPLNAKLMLLSFTGRKTGRAYLQPVSYVPDGDTLLTPAGGKWKLNLNEGEPIRVWLRGGKQTASSLRLVETAYEVGIRYFDVARMYASGEAEGVWPGPAQACSSANAHNATSPTFRSTAPPP